MHTAWAKNRRSWKLFCSWKTVICLQSQKPGDMTHATGGLQWMAINSSEGIGKE